MLSKLVNKLKGKQCPRKQDSMSHHVEQGTVKWFGPKGFGFLVRDNGQPDAFAHHQNINAEGYRTLEEGQRVEFEVEDTDRGPSAKNITVI